MERSDYLAKLPLFQSVPLRVLQNLAGACRPRRVEAGQTLFYRGDAGSTLCIVVKGRLTIQTTNAEGAIQHIADRGPGEHVGELSLLDGGTRSADVVATETTDLLILNHADFRQALRDSPDLAWHVTTSLAKRLREQSERLAKLSEQDALGKLCVVLLELSKSDPVIRATQSEIAARLGVTRETVNRSLGQLTGVGAVAREGRSIRVLDKEFLVRRSDYLDYDES